jgi:hypothetical protein
MACVFAEWSAYVVAVCAGTGAHGSLAVLRHPAYVDLVQVGVSRSGEQMTGIGVLTY